MTMQGQPRSIAVIAFTVLSILLALVLALSFLGDAQISLPLTSGSAYFAGAHGVNLYLARQSVVFDSESPDYHGDVSQWGRFAIRGKFSTRSIGTYHFETPRKLPGLGWEIDQTTVCALTNGEIMERGTGLPREDEIAALVVFGSQGVFIAWWWILPILMLPWLIWAAKFRLNVRLRRQRGMCLNCGYDLRASPERCPECGTAVPSAQGT
jgi:hypothetical protein